MAIDINNNRLLFVALMPGAAEGLRGIAQREGNMALDDIGMGIQMKRNLVYLNVALTAIAAVGAFFATAPATLTGIAIFTAVQIASAFFAVRSLKNVEITLLREKALEALRVSDDLRAQ